MTFRPVYITCELTPDVGPCKLRGSKVYFPEDELILLSVASRRACWLSARLLNVKSISGRAQSTQSADYPPPFLTAVTHLARLTHFTG